MELCLGVGAVTACRPRNTDLHTHTQINTACPNSNIYMTGYPTPPESFSECAIDKTGAGTRKLLNNPVQAACTNNAKCTYAEATNVAGGTDSTPVGRGVVTSVGR